MLNPAILLDPTQSIRTHFTAAAELALTAYPDPVTHVNAKTHAEYAINWLKSDVAEGFWFQICDALIFSFRGTETYEALDILTDLDIRRVELVGIGCCHRGFLSYANRNWEEIQEIINSKNPKHVILVGHSLGSAVASLVAVKIHQSMVVRPKISLWLYGAPRVFDAAGRTWFFETFARWIHSLRNGSDSICLGPRRYAGPMWTHALLHDGTLTDRKLTTFQMLCERASDILAMLSRGERYTPQSVADHKISSYVSALRKTL